MEEEDKQPQDIDPESNSPQEIDGHKLSPQSDEMERGNNSHERFSRSRIQYEADAEDLELRKKLQESKMARKKAEEDAKILMNRLMLLKNEEQKVVLCRN